MTVAGAGAGIDVGEPPKRGSKPEGVAIDAEAAGVDVDADVGGSGSESGFAFVAAPEGDTVMAAAPRRFFEDGDSPGAAMVVVLVVVGIDCGLAGSSRE